VTAFVDTALIKTALALLGPQQSEDELQEIFSVAEDKELRLRTLPEEFSDGDNAEFGDTEGNGDDGGDDAEGDESIATTT